MKFIKKWWAARTLRSYGICPKHDLEMDYFGVSGVNYVCSQCRKEEQQRYQADVVAAKKTLGLL